MTNNMNPMAIDLPSALVDTFDTFVGDIQAASISGAALAASLSELGVLYMHLSKPGKNASPEHKYGNAVFTRLGVHKLARVMGVSETLFAPVYNGSVESGGAVTIGDKTQTVRQWKTDVSNALRPVKSAMERLLRDQIAEAKAEAAFAETARAAAREDAAKAEAALQAAREIAAKTGQAAADAEAARDAAPRGQKAQAAAVAKRKAAEAEAREKEVLALFEHAEEAQEVELACMSELTIAKDAVAALEAQLGAKPKAAQAPKTDAEKWHAALRKVLGDVKGAVSPTGSADVPDVVAGLERAIAACNVVVSE